MQDLLTPVARLLVPILLASQFGCASGGIFFEQGNVSDVNQTWIAENCSQSDVRSAEPLNFRNCQKISKYQWGNAENAYRCTFKEGTEAGLFERTPENNVRLLCGVNTDGTVYSDGSANTSTAVKVVAIAAAVAVVAAAADGGSGGSSCPSSYGERPLWDLQSNGWYCRNANNGQYTHACKCSGQTKIDNWQ